MVAQVDNCDKMAKSMTDKTTHFWMRVVHDKQLQQIDAQLHEAEAYLASMRESLKIMPPVV